MSPAIKERMKVHTGTLAVSLLFALMGIAVTRSIWAGIAIIITMQAAMIPWSSPEFPNT